MDSYKYAFRPDRGDGLDLRRLTYGDEEVASRLYFALRDELWGTIPFTIHSRQFEPTGDGFRLRIEASASTLPTDVILEYVAAGPTLTARFRAQAREGYTYGRLGFCLLLSAQAMAGRPARSSRAGVVTPYAFPTRVVTRDQHDANTEHFHAPFDRLDSTLPSGAAVSYVFGGEEFEFEDQRNWTDATYKAYSVRPQGPWPLHTVPGQVFEQRVRLVVAHLPQPRVSPESSGSVGRIQVGPVVRAMPPVTLFRGRVTPTSLRPAGGFVELQTRDIDGHEAIELGINGTVHAADDDSLLESATQHGVLVGQVRSTFPGKPVILAPVSFLDVPGDWRDDRGEYIPQPPPGPLPARAAGPIGAAWCLHSAARAVPAGADRIDYFDASIASDSPAATTVARLGALAGRPVFAVTAPAPLAALAVAVDGAVHLAVVNPGPDPAAFVLPDGRSASLPGFGFDWYTVDVSVAQDPTER